MINISLFHFCNRYKPKPIGRIGRTNYNMAEELDIPEAVAHFPQRGSERNVCLAGHQVTARMVMGDDNCIRTDFQGFGEYVLRLNDRRGLRAERDENRRGKRTASGKAVVSISTSLLQHCSDMNSASMIRLPDGKLSSASFAALLQGNKNAPSIDLAYVMPFHPIDSKKPLSGV